MKVDQKTTRKMSHLYIHRIITPVQTTDIKKST